MHSINLEIIDFKNKYEKEALQLFYRSVFYNRKEFEYARLPTWSHRYLLEEESLKRLAVINEKIIGSLGIISYYCYVNGKKQKIGFFVDNCVLPEYQYKYEQVLSKLFENIEEHAKEDRIKYILGWEYKNRADVNNLLYKKMGYSRIDGINWFGGGTKHVHFFDRGGFQLSPLWKIGLKLFGIKHHLCKARLKPLHNEKIRKMSNSDLPKVVDLINVQNENLEFSPKYTAESLKKIIQKYHAEGIVVETNRKIIGVIILFVAPWSGWMYGKPEYSKSYGFLLIKHPLEFAVHPEYSERIAPHLLFEAMIDEKKGKYLMLVDVFDRRISWLKKAFSDVGADEIPYDFGTVFYKNLTGEKVKLNSPIYIPTNLVISPYTAKDY